MTSLLAIETSTDACSVALAHHHLIRETFVIRPREHNQILLSMVQDVLSGVNLAIADLDAIAFGAGPGSFTGLRLSASVTQGLAFSAQKPVIAISSLAALALSAAEAMHSAPSQTLLTILDARLQDVYFGAYCYEIDQQGQGYVSALAADSLVPLSQLTQQLAHYPTAVIVGDGCPPELIPASATRCVLPVYPHAKAVLALAKTQWAAGQTISAEQALPVYLRESVAWQKWQPKNAANIPSTSV